jgi:hypothetical protein
MSDNSILSKFKFFENKEVVRLVAMVVGMGVMALYFQSKMGEMKNQIEQLNSRIDEQDEKIDSILRSVGGSVLGLTPKQQPSSNVLNTPHNPPSPNVSQNYPKAPIYNPPPSTTINHHSHPPPKSSPPPNPFPSQPNGGGGGGAFNPMSFLSAFMPAMGGAGGMGGMPKIPPMKTANAEEVEDDIDEQLMAKEIKELEEEDSQNMAKPTATGPTGENATVQLID